MKRIFIYLFIIFLAESSPPILAEVVPLKSLNYDDENYITLSYSTISSKNRMIKGTRKDEYSEPIFFIYSVGAQEDIWTIIAKTSLNIDTIATLNRLDFIGMVREGKEVYLSDTLGLYFRKDMYDKPELAQLYSIGEEEILTVSSPFERGELLYFLPEIELSFLERTFLTGVVFHAPILGVQTSGYGKRIDPFVNEMTFHGGIDISAKEGKIVRASRSGKVFYADAENGYGNLVILRHELGYYTLYGHLGEILVEKDENIERGQPLGRVGITGKTTGPHLHFEIRRYNQQLNPENIPLFLEHDTQIQ